MKYTFRILIFLSLLFTADGFGQVNRYAVYFFDKSNSPYDISRPLEFLSNRSVQRRVNRKAFLGKSDLPVNPSFIQQVRDKGVKILFRSKWLNAVVIEAEASQLTGIAALPVVLKTEYLGPGPVPAPTTNDIQLDWDTIQRSIQSKTAELSAQLTMVGIDAMHAEGFQGEGLLIAVMDSGFPGVNSASSFSSIFPKVKDSYNFAFNQKNVFGFDGHGTTVLSVIGGNSGTLRGSAPKSDYLLYVTEYVPSEYRIEEFNWVLAAERADSIGVDVINTSLGYFTFDDATMNYRYQDMNGKTSIISQAAQVAAEAGILVVASAGNEGAGNWQYVTAPADAEDVLAVGAVDGSLVRAGFSSKGPSADGRIKPDLMAQGVSTSIIEPSGSVITGNGTSFSAPILSGFAAGVLQAYPDLSIKEILKKLKSSGSMANQPDALMGYGIPDYVRLRGGLITGLSDEKLPVVYPNPTMDRTVRIRNYAPIDSDKQPVLLNIHGQQIYSLTDYDDESAEWVLQADGAPAGLYFLKAGEKVMRILFK